MRLYASLGALTAIGLFGIAAAESPPPTGDQLDTCEPTATTTVFITVAPTNAAVSAPVGVKTITAVDPGHGDPGSPDGQAPVSPTYTVTLEPYGPSGDSPYTGPRPWESRPTPDVGIATATVTIHSSPSSGPHGSDTGPGDGSGHPGDVPGLPGDGPQTPGGQTPGDQTPGVPGTPGDGQHPLPDGSQTPGDQTPGGPGGPGVPDPNGPYPDGSQPGNVPSGAPGGSPAATDCVTVITTTLFKTSDAGQGVPTVDTVVATFTVTFPGGSSGEETGGTGGPPPTASPSGPVGGDSDISVVTRTVYHPTLAPGQPTVSRDVIVETVTIHAVDPHSPDASVSDGTYPPGVTSGPNQPGDEGGPGSVIVTTLYHSRTLPGEGIVTVDTVVASFTVTFPPHSPQGPDGLPEPTGAPHGPGGGDVIFIPTTWYEHTVCPDPSGNLTPTIKTYISTIASTLANQPPTTGAPGSDVPGSPDSGKPGSPDGAGDPHGPGSDSPGGPHGPGGPGSESPGSPDYGTPGGPGGPSSDTPGGPHGPGGPGSESPGGPGSESPGSPDHGTPGGPGGPGSDSPGGPHGPGGPGSESPGSPDHGTPEGPGGPGSDSPGGPHGPGGPSSDSPGGPHGPGGPGADHSGSAAGEDIVTVITETVFYPLPTPGSPGHPAPSVETITATITASFPDVYSTGVPVPGDDAGHGDVGISTVITTVLSITLYSDVSPAGPGKTPPIEGSVVETLTVTIPHPSISHGGTPGSTPFPTPAPGGPDPSSPGADGAIITSLYRTATFIGPDGRPTVSIDTFVATLTPTDSTVPTPTSPEDGSGPFVTVVTKTVLPTHTAPGDYGTPSAPDSPNGPHSPGGPDGPGDPAPSVVVVTSTIFTPPSSATHGPSGDDSDPSAGTGLEDGSATLLTVTFEKTLPAGPDATGPDTVHTIVQTLTYTFPTAEQDGPNPTAIPGTPGESGPPGQPGGPGATPPGDGAPDDYGQVSPTGPGVPVPPADGNTEISGTVHVVKTMTFTHTVPADYGDVASVFTFLSPTTVDLPASPPPQSSVTLWPPHVSETVDVSALSGDGPQPAPTGPGGQPPFSILPVPSQPGDPSAPGQPGDPSTPGQPAPGQSGQPGDPSAPSQPVPGQPGDPSAPSQPGDPSAPGQPAPGQSGQPGDPSAPGQPGDPSAPGQPAPGQPGDPSAPGQPAPGQPGDPSAPGQPAPGQSGQPGDPSAPSQPGDPSAPGQPGDPSAPGQPGDPSAPGQPGDPSAPGQPAPGQPAPGQPQIPGQDGEASLKTTCTISATDGSGGPVGPESHTPASTPSGTGDGSLTQISPIVAPPGPTDAPASPPSFETTPGGYGFSPAGPLPSDSPGDLPETSVPAHLTSAALPTIATPGAPSDGSPSHDPIGQPTDGSPSVITKDCPTTLRTLVVTSVETSTFVNVIPQLTTTYSIPYEILVTAESTIITEEALPTFVRRFKRQEDETTGPIFTNTSSPVLSPGGDEQTATTLFPTTSASSPVNTTASTTDLSTALTTSVPGPADGFSTPTPTTITTDVIPTSLSDLASTPANTSAVIATGTPSIPVQVPICTGSTEVGNLVIDFDDMPIGPIYNPYDRFWFSTGFLVAPPPTVPYVPSSGGRLLEFVPPVLTNATSTSTLDAAQIGVGVDAASECFHFNFFGANLGCDARQEDQFCEFTFTGFRFDPSLNAEVQAMSQLAWVPSCPELTECALTPFLVEDFEDITSVLITLRVDGEPRTWWADDVRVGWSDNSCDAGSCRAGTPRRTVKRDETHEAAWYWTIDGFRRLGSRVFNFRN